MRVTGGEDSNWLYVQLSRARHQTTLYPVVGPEPQEPAELDLPDRDPGDGYTQLAQALARAGDQTLAIDTPSTLDLRRLSTKELRAERDRLQGLLDQAPRDRARELGGPAPAGPRSTRPWSSSPPRTARGARARGCFACGGGPDRPAPDRGGSGGPPAGRPRPHHRTRAAPAAAASGRLAGGQRPPRPHLPAGPAGAGLAAPRPPAWPPSTTDPPICARSSGRCPSRPGGGGPGGRPPPRSRTTAAAMGSPTPTRRWARHRGSPPSGPPGSRPATAAQRTKDRQRTPHPPGADGIDPPQPPSTAVSKPRPCRR